MSLLTINKLTESVGAEVLGVDSDRLATDDALGAAVLEALEDNGVLVFPVSAGPEAQVAFCRASATSTTPPTVTTPSPASIRSRWTSRRIPRRLPAGDVRLAHRRLYPDRGHVPQMATVLSRSRSPNAGG
jgi:alpha-ketoglutarate-dependent taurine dioxygenase